MDQLTQGPTIMSTKLIQAFIYLFNLYLFLRLTNCRRDYHVNEVVSVVNYILLILIFSKWTNCRRDQLSCRPSGFWRLFIFLIYILKRGSSVARTNYLVDQLVGPLLEKLVKVATIMSINL